MEILLSILSKSDGSVREIQRAIDDGLTVGRGAEDGVLLEGADLSREHFILTGDGTTIYVTDLSVNGTWLNGKRLEKSVRSLVRSGESIEVPGYLLSFRSIEQLHPSKVAGEFESPGPSLVVPQPQPASAPASMVEQKQGSLAILQPISQFLSSFTATEKFMFFVALTGLLLIYSYVAS